MSDQKKKRPKRLTSADLKRLHQTAVAAQKQSYSPYSKFPVGASLHTDQGIVVAGCNVENSSYGATICAERNAIGTLVSLGYGKHHISDVVVVSNLTRGVQPCGICRQVLLEFSGNPEQTRIHFANKNKILRTVTLAELLPLAFGPRSLLRRQR